MLKSFGAAVLLFVGLAYSETPPGFTPEAAVHLDVIFGSKAVSPPGTSLTKSGSHAPIPSHGHNANTASPRHPEATLNRHLGHDTERNLPLAHDWYPSPHGYPHRAT